MQYNSCGIPTEIRKIYKLETFLIETVLNLQTVFQVSFKFKI